MYGISCIGLRIRAEADHSQVMNPEWSVLIEWSTDSLIGLSCHWLTIARAGSNDCQGSSGLKYVWTVKQFKTRKMTRKAINFHFDCVIVSNHRNIFSVHALQMVDWLVVCEIVRSFDWLFDRSMITSSLHQYSWVCYESYIKRRMDV